MGIDNKGQASAELLFVTLVALIIFGAFVGLINTATNQTQIGSLGEARMQGEKIAEAINSVYSHGDGYAINITIPPTPKITASINNPAPNYITIFYESQNITIKLIALNVQTMNITSDPQGKNNIIYTIKNNNGMIIITKN